MNQFAFMFTLDNALGRRQWLQCAVAECERERERERGV
jgi:hypothetical protein